MYIIAELHPMYGAFKQIQKDNYPFKHAFESYLFSMSQLGMDLQLPVDALVGFLEDSLIEGRLPDIPQGETPIKFKFTIDQPLIEQYFDSTFGRQAKPLTHKRSILLIIRMTLRLSEVYGTSLARLTTRIERLRMECMEQKSGDPAKRPMDTTTFYTPDQEHKEAKAQPIKSSRGNCVKISPATVPVTSKTDSVVPPSASEATSNVSSSTVLKRLERLTEEGEKLLSKEDDPPVVETNPALLDFFG